MSRNMYSYSVSFAPVIIPGKAYVKPAQKKQPGTNPDCP